jgi:DNA-binding GntR family transcriptional regulator
MPSTARSRRPANHARGESADAPLLKEQAYGELKRRILELEYPPGSFLAERKLASELRMSKTPVKAALERLESEGFIAVSPQQGIVVRELTIDEIVDQYEIRAALESYVLRTVAGRLTEAQIARLRANLQAQSRVRATDSARAAVAVDADFHLLFAEFLGNREILRTMENLRQKMQRIIMQVFHLNPQRIRTSLEEHTAIVELVIAGRGDQAARAIEVHLEQGKQMILSPRRFPA